MNTEADTSELRYLVRVGLACVGFVQAMDRPDADPEYARERLEVILGAIHQLENAVLFGSTSPAARAAKMSQSLAETLVHRYRVSLTPELTTSADIGRILGVPAEAVEPMLTGGVFPAVLCHGQPAVRTQDLAMGLLRDPEWWLLYRDWVLMPMVADMGAPDQKRRREQAADGRRHV